MSRAAAKRTTGVMPDGQGLDGGAREGAGRHHVRLVPVRCRLPSRGTYVQLSFSNRTRAVSSA